MEVTKLKGFEVTKLEGFEQHFEIIERVATKQNKDINIFINEAVKALVEDLPKANADLRACHDCIEMLRSKVERLSVKLVNNTNLHIYELKLLEKMRVKDVEITRVPGGWVFDNSRSMVFVGWDDEFEIG